MDVERVVRKMLFRMVYRMDGRVFEQMSWGMEGWIEGKVGEWLDIVLRV